MSTIRERIRQEEEQAQIDACYDGLEMRPVYEAYSRGELLPADEVEARIAEAVAAERERRALIAEDDTAERIKELETAYAGERFRRAELETTLDEMMHALNMILPLARGYNAYQGTACPESNRRCVKAAEIALRNADAAIELCKHGAGS